MQSAWINTITLVFICFPILTSHRKLENQGETFLLFLESNFFKLLPLPIQNKAKKICIV